MATISKSGIALSSVIQPTHTLNIINALDGTDVTDVIVSGSLKALDIAATGSLKGSASYALSALSASYALTASHLTGYVSPFPYTGSAIITGSLQVIGSITGSAFFVPGTGNQVKISTGNGNVSITNDDNTITAGSRMTVDFSGLGGVYSRGLILPTTAPPSPVNGSVYWDGNGGVLHIYDGSAWLEVALGT